VSSSTAIEWTEATWNPVTGCVEVSEGCDHCYARTFAERFRGVPDHPFEQGFDVRLWPERLTLPLQWRKPKQIFVNSMSDLFIESVPTAFCAKVFATMAVARKHVFQVLTKRPGRARSLLASDEFKMLVQDEAEQLAAERGLLAAGPLEWPLPNVWMGVSVETQRWAQVRLPLLAQTPASVHFASCEPLLGPLDLRPWLGSGLDWVIVGGESGAGFRPLDLGWARQIRDDCVDLRVSFLFKQVGGRTPKAGGRELDGRTWDQMPGGATCTP
jgi:protein gp37